MARSQHKRRRTANGTAALDFVCMDCGVDTHATFEYYALKDTVWRRINPLKIGMLCLRCAEDRLGRPLYRSDFARLPINEESARSCLALARRLHRPRPKFARY